MSETHAITVEKVLPYAAEKIWRTLTTGELIARWLMPNDFVARSAIASPFAPGRWAIGTAS